MFHYKLLTNKYKHEYSFEFNDQKYLVHSAVKLSDQGKKYLQSLTYEAILTEVFYYFDGRKCWTYEFRDINFPCGATRASTDVPPHELIEEVVTPASGGYMLREIVGPEWGAEPSKKQTKRDLEIPEVRTGWIIFTLVSIFAFIFKDWYITATIHIAAIIWFAKYRQQYINANTIYTHDEDTEMLKKKYEILYGLKNDKEHIDNE